MFQMLFLTQLTAVLFVSFVAALALLVYDNTRRRRKCCYQPDQPEPPSPRGFPIIGHLHLLGGYEVPYQAFSALGKKYGDVVKLRLGAVNCVVINGPKNIRETLVTKGHHFDSRPNFERYQRLFCGNKENSLAFCNWSDTQKKRRDMLKAFTFPRALTNKYRSLEAIIAAQGDQLINAIAPGEAVAIKPLILRHCANIFTAHFCSSEFRHDDPAFVSMVEDFDEIFWEVNQGYAADFLPFLLPLHRKNLAKMNTLAHNIRAFILERVIGARYGLFQADDEPVDYVESLIEHVRMGRAPELSWETALFALEDIIGGHSAVGNFLVKLLGFLVNHQEVQRKIQEDIDMVTREDGGYRPIKISDRARLPYVEGVIFEAIRLIASPVVPRVANQDSSVGGYSIRKDTLIFLNNYDLSMSDQLWDQPDAFKPERFVVDGRLVKPEHFLPFGGGRRSCMGYKMVQLVSFGLLTGLLQKYTIRPRDGGAASEYKVPIGSLALPKDSFSFKFEER